MTDACVYFDKQGTMIKSADFFSLLKNKQFHQFISNVRKTFKEGNDDTEINDSTDKLTPDEIYEIHYGTGTQPEDLDETKRLYVEQMLANGYRVPSFYESQSPLSSDSEPIKPSSSKSPLVSKKRKSLISKETIQKLKKL